MSNGFVYCYLTSSHFIHSHKSSWHHNKAADVHQTNCVHQTMDYDLMDANKKVDFKQVQCPPERKILMYIIKDHPLRFSIAASSSVPWIYMAQFWHTLKEDGSKYRLTFMLDKKMLSLTLEMDYSSEQTFTYHKQNDNNHDIIPWQTLCKIFSKCLTTRVTGWDQPPLQIMQMIFTKIIISHYMTNFPKISRRARDIYHNLKDDDIMKNIFNSGRHKDRVGMKIPDWMISDENGSTQALRNGLRRRDDFTRHTTIKSSESQRSREEQRSLENKVELVNKHLAISRGRKGNIVEDLEYTIPPYQLRSLRIHTDLGCYGYLFEHLRAKFLSRKSFNTLADHLQEVMVESLPTYRESGPTSYDAPPKGRNSAKAQKTILSTKHNYGESSEQVNEREQSPSSSGDSRQYHIDQMKNFLKSDIVWESRKEILASPHPRKTTPLVQRPEKNIVVLHKFPTKFSMKLISKNGLPDG
ncbi:hypothetical protein Tco_0357575 [Tanacetum coccineum]